jgi:hypothetical protein
LPRQAASRASFIDPSEAPFTTTLPEEGLSIPPIMLSKVDFPLPDFPTTATSFPGSNATSMPRNAINSPAGLE